MLLGLEELAHETSSDKRRELLNRVTSMFLDGAEDHTDRESALFADVVLQVLDEIGVEDRVDYSQSVAEQDIVPSSVIRRLAHDEIDVASPVLTRSPVLTDNDLVEMAGQVSQDHLQAISRRKSLSEAVTDRLIEHGNNDVARTVSANIGARFSSSGLTRLAEVGADDDTVMSNITGRGDLRQQIVDTVLPLVSSDYAARLRAMIETAGDDVIDTVVSAAENEISADRATAARNRLETRTIINEIQSRARSVDDAIVYLTDQSRFSDMVTVFARLSGITENVVSNVMFKTNNEPVAILCRAVGAGTPGFKAIQNMRASKLRFPRSHLERGMRDFAQLDQQTAKRSLRFVKVRASVA